jgi:hypothetical protein
VKSSVIGICEEATIIVEFAPPDVDTVQPDNSIFHANGFRSRLIDTACKEEPVSYRSAARITNRPQALLPRAFRAHASRQAQPPTGALLQDLQIASRAKGIAQFCPAH